VLRWRDLNALDDLLAASAGMADRGLAGARESFPRLNLYECEAGYELVAPLPGVPAMAIDLTIEHDVLTIRGERRPFEPEGASPVRRERRRGPFARQITLPAPVAADRVEAALRDGVLRVLLPKSPAATPRRIEIRTPGSSSAPDGGSL
jgi:HSP20 family protein